MDGKKSHNRIELTLEETYHERLMYGILENIQNTSLVLKGFQNESEFFKTF